MKFYQRAFCYLWRKKTKTILLFTVFLAAGSMIICSILILRASQDANASIQEKTKSKLVMEITDQKTPITDAEIKKIKTLANVASVNKIVSHPAYPSGFEPVTYNGAGSEENKKVTVCAYDDTESDGAFAEQKYRLVAGHHLNNVNSEGILINFMLASQNGIEVGDSLELCSADGKTEKGVVIGIFQSGSERRQDEAVEAVYRVENQIYIDHRLSVRLFGTAGYSKVSVYASDPEQLTELNQQIQEIVGNKVEIINSSALYQKMKAPLLQIARITKLMLALTLLTAVVVITLLLCMWMRGRQKENAVLISLGEKKEILYMQAVLESLTVFIASAAGAAILGNLAAREIKDLLLNAQSGVLLHIQVQIGDIGYLLLIGSAVVLFAVGISLFSILWAVPKDILSNMEG